MATPIDVVILAAGKGTRMNSQRPKVLQPLAGQPLLAHVLRCAGVLGARKAIVITGHEAAQVETACLAMQQPYDKDLTLQFARQEPQLGTGHAVQQALPGLTDGGITVVLSGDVPLIQSATLQALIAQCAGQHLALLTLCLTEPRGYGRIVRSTDTSAGIEAIVEEKDASAAQREIQEIYSGIMAAPTHLLRRWLARLDNNNAQKEYYLTDIVKLSVADHVAVLTYTTQDALEVAGVNSAAQLAALERAYQLRIAADLMTQGVRLADPARLDVRGPLTCGQDVEIDVNCVFSGQVTLGDGVQIGANCVIANANIAAGAVIYPFTHIEGKEEGIEVGPGALVGPFARLRPGTRLGAEVHIGNFVEVKNSTLAAGAKANHLAYLGDASLGQRVNYGAGSITANYDGANKHRTVIEADAHIGSNCVLVAPVTVGAGGTVGAGSTITKDTEPGSLSVSRSKQLEFPHWTRPVKSRKP